MVVSRYVVDAIVIAGLMAGTAGVFCLASGLFGVIGNGVLRFVLAAIPTALWFGWLADLLSELAPFGIHVPGVISWLLGGVLGIVLIRFSAHLGDDLHWSELSPFQDTGWLVLPALASLLAGIEAASKSSIGTALLVALAVFLIYVSFILVAFGIFVVLTGLLFIVQSRALYLSSRQMQYLGLVLTLFGVATQFMSPILDLLNIPVR